MSIVGRPGIGKTGLACKVLEDVTRSARRPDGLIALSAEKVGGDSLSADRIFDMAARLLPADHPFDALRRDPKTSAAAKTAALIEALHGQWIVLYLDNLEVAQHAETGALLNDDLRELIETVLTQGNGMISILITSWYTVELPNPLRVKDTPIRLEQGLPEGEAVAFLRELGGDLFPADDAPLRTLIDKTRGFPRALEAAVGWLKNTPSGTLTELLTDAPLMEKEVTSYFVQRALDALPPIPRRIVEGLSVLHGAVELTALEYLLAPFMDTHDLRTRLDRLVNDHIVAFNRASGVYSLHSLDRAYASAHIQSGTADELVDEDAEPYSRRALRERAAVYYRERRKPQSQWKTLADVQPQLAEFEYRIDLEDYDSAAALLLDIDFDYLLLWGYAPLVIGLHERLQGQIVASWLARRSVGTLGHAYSDVGRMTDAIRCYERALASARAEEDQEGEGVWLGNLGVAYRALGQVERAIAYCEQALVIAREIGDRGGEGRHLGNLWNAYYALGQVERAIEYHEQALAISREIGDRGGEGVWLGNLGEALTDLGRYVDAITRLGQYIHIADEVQSPREKNYGGSYLARAHLLSGDLNAAVTAIHEARRHDAPENNHAAAALHGIILARLNDAAASAAFTDAIRHADAILTVTPRYYEARYAKALALTGLAFRKNEPLDAAHAEYTAALDNCSAKGVVRRELGLLDALMQGRGGDRLQSIRALLAARA
ncbi:MAG: tetratricopeptide repeat protein [Chloroflexota bacterium]|nr:tetratricopeptide repeat protein [Chloroflexota bacterium]